jgi:hypothetical protein
MEKILNQLSNQPGFDAGVVQQALDLAAIEHLQQLQAVRAELASSYKTIDALKAERDMLQASLPHVSGRVRNEARAALGKVLRWRPTDAEFPSFPVVDANQAFTIVEGLLADKEHALQQVKEKALDIADLEECFSLIRDVLKDFGTDCDMTPSMSLNDAVRLCLLKVAGQHTDENTAMRDIMQEIAAALGITDPIQIIAGACEDNDTPGKVLVRTLNARLKKSENERLLHVKAHMQAEPRRLRMSVWQQKVAAGDSVRDDFESLNGNSLTTVAVMNEDDIPPCNTVGCIAGWTDTLYPSDRRYDSISVRAQKALGLTISQATQLFYPFEWSSWLPGNHEMRYAGAATALQRVEVVAEVIDAFVEKFGYKARK